ncbi:hypothetical protein D3C85_993810 [compost metagenome]
MNLFSVRGELAGWQVDMASKCEGNRVLAIGCALAGPLLSLMGVLGEIRSRNRDESNGIPRSGSTAGARMILRPASFSTT